MASVSEVWSKVAGVRSAAETTPTIDSSLQVDDGPPAEEVERGDEDGVYAVVKKSNYWFNRELWQIEQEATKAGREWADGGLPHPAMVHTEPLPIEKALMAKCRETFQQWIERVKTKMQDAIETAGQEVAHRMVALRFAVRHIADVEVDLVAAQRDARALRRSLRDKEIPFGYKRLISPWAAYSVLAALVCVEFIANFPVFRLMLPLSGQLAEASERLGREATDAGVWTGLVHLMNELMLRPEATAVAFVVVIALVVSSDLFGASLRPLRALSASDHPGAAVGIRRLQRQHSTRLAITGLAAVLVLSALFFGRRTLSANAGGRVEDARAEYQQLQSQFDSLLASQSPQAPALRGRVAQKARELQLRQEELAYAQTIQRSNGAILLLNIAIVLAAAGLGYSVAQENLRDELTEDPAYVEARQRIAELSHLAVRYRQEAQEAIAATRAGISNVEHLQLSRPFDDWPAKRDRLQGAVQIFRAVNASARKLDPGNIAAFQVPAIIDFPQVPNEPLRAPVGFSQFTTELRDLVAEYERVSRRIAAEVDASDEASIA